MNIVHKAILHTCWQQENENGMHPPRPWLRWLLTCVVRMKGTPARESETKQRKREQWLEVRKEAGLRIDPEHAQIFWEYGSVRDRYELYDLIGEEDNVGRSYFARPPGSDVWVSFHDLPAAVCDRLWTKMKAGDFNHHGDEVPF
jgi:hypothetical protein